MAELTETNWKAVVDDLRSDILDTDEMAVDPNVHLKNIDSLIEFHTKVLEPNTRALDERVKELDKGVLERLIHHCKCQYDEFGVSPKARDDKWLKAAELLDEIFGKEQP